MGWTPDKIEGCEVYRKDLRQRNNKATENEEDDRSDGRIV